MIDGDIYRGDLRTGEGSVFIDVSYRQALGLKVDRRHHLLFVAGGFTGHGYVYDARTGADVADYEFRSPDRDPRERRRGHQIGGLLHGYVRSLPLQAPIGADGIAGSRRDDHRDRTSLVVGSRHLRAQRHRRHGQRPARSSYATPSSGNSLRSTPATGASTEITLTSGSLVQGTPWTDPPPFPQPLGGPELRQPRVPRTPLTGLVERCGGGDSQQPGLPCPDNRCPAWQETGCRQRQVRPRLPAAAWTRGPSRDAVRGGSVQAVRLAWLRRRSGDMNLMAVQRITASRALGTLVARSSCDG